jgi:hypothetical protein
VTIGAGDLEEEDQAQRAALEQAFAGNEEAQEYLQRLQGMVDEQQVPGAENIGDEVERFLRNRRRGGEEQNPFGL